MSQENALPPAADTLNQVAARIEAWCNGPKKPNRITEEIRQTAFKLSKQYSINQVAKTLRLGYNDLKRRVKSHTPKNMPAVEVQLEKDIVAIRTIEAHEPQTLICNGNPCNSGVTPMWRRISA